MFLRTKTRCLEENEEKHGRKENLERFSTNEHARKRNVVIHIPSA